MLNLPETSKTEPVKEHPGRCTFCTLSRAAIDERFRQVAEEVEIRWDRLTKDISFPGYIFQREEEAIIAEFNQFSHLRYELAFDSSALPYQSNPEFKVAQELLLNGRYRQPNTISYEHSLADSSYNASCIQVGKRKFLALEGPTEAHVPHFFRLLLNWNVSSVVCLTADVDKDGSKCHPYWIGRADGARLQIPMEGQYGWPLGQCGAREVPFLAWHDWQDHHGVDPHTLIASLEAIRKNEGLIAVHCSGGVGRTGTFIAALSLLDAIDAGEEINIAKLFLHLNFHRPCMVSRALQYLTLYRLADLGYSLKK